MHYSKSTRGFYDGWQQKPDDAVEVSEEQYKALFVAQAEGKEIIADENGCPIAINPRPQDTGAVPSDIGSVLLGIAGAHL